MKSRFTAAGILESEKSLRGFGRRRLVRSVGAWLETTAEILQRAANVLCPSPASHRARTRDKVTS